ARRGGLLALRYTGRRGARAGFRDRAGSLRGQALAFAERLGDRVMRAVILGDLRRHDEARQIAMDQFRGGELHPDHAMELFLRLDDPSSAQRALELLDASGWTPAPDRTWEQTARHAELHAALMDHP